MKKILALTFFVSVLITGCKKNQAGGNSEIQGTVVHHSSPVANANIYIKFNATEFPGTDLTVYDTQLKAGSDGTFSFKCYKGNYFLYGVGTEVIAGKLVQVDGGAPVTIRAKEVVEAKIPVSEVH